MFHVVRNSWALLLGVMLLMIGNGLQGTLLGLRGAIEGYSASTMSYVMSAYFLGFLLGSKLTPMLIRRVGHVRVFAALASLISAIFILYAAITHPLAWLLMRLLVGLCISGVYVVAESWLNASSTNETRGQALSVYLVVQMVGIITAQGLLNLADAGGYALFVVMSVLVSVSFAPILLSVSPAPVFETTKAMSLRRLFHVSPLGMVGALLLGGVLSALFGMAPVYATEAGMSTAQVSIFVAAIYTGGMLMQFPIGWLSDRMDRRLLIMGLTLTGAVTVAAALPLMNVFLAICAIAFLIGGIANPMYALLIAYTNDFLDHSDMTAASGGLMFTYGTGAVLGPIMIGWLMHAFGAWTFFAFIATLFGLISGYAAYRMTQRPAPSVGQTTSYAPVLPQASPVAVELAQEYAIEQAQESEMTHAAEDEPVAPVENAA